MTQETTIAVERGDALGAWHIRLDVEMTPGQSVDRLVEALGQAHDEAVRRVKA